MRNLSKYFLSMVFAVLLVLSSAMFVFATDGETAAVITNDTGKVGPYEDVTAALAAAEAEQIVELSKDAEAGVVSVPAGVTLNLNGHTLKADYVTCFGNIVDNSESNDGMLIVKAERFLIQSGNTQMPVKSGEGYKFFEVSDIDADYFVDTAKYWFKPSIETAGHTFLTPAATSGVTVNVRVSWTQDGGVRTQNLVYSDELVAQYLKAPNKRMFTLVVSGAENFDQLTYSAVVASDTGVALASEAKTISNGSGDVEADENNQVKEELNLQDGSAYATVSVGTQLDDATKKLTLAVKEMDETTSNVELGETEEMISVDVHVDGVSENNQVPIIVTLSEFAPEYMNQGNIALYHVENGKTVPMIRVDSIAEVDEHNEYYYDTVTGTVTMALATFSEVAVVADTENAWKGDFDYSWYTNAVAPAAADVTADYVIANADQLAAFGAIVGGMAKDKDGNAIARDSFAEKTVKLLADINLGDKEAENNAKLIFYPIGYYNNAKSYEKVSGGDVTSGVKSFEGKFDGNGHTVSNFYQNTWEMFGDYNSGYSETPNHYKDAMGLFGYVKGGTVENLTVDNFSSDGEFTPTGVIAAYAVNSTFKNIAITNCNPRVYNTGNGGIVGIGGNSDDPDTHKLTFTNITIDNTNKITALWGSWDVACGGIMGMFRGNADGGNGKAHFENCHVAAQMDVNNDVCANYQYYWYRYSGMMIGSIRHNETNEDGYTYPNMTGITASGCTVHYGKWNDYFYCELVDNSIASYTHDYQFSRLEEVDEFPDSAEGTKHYVKVARNEDGTIAKNEDGSLKSVECRHFINGKIHTHDMSETETVDGKSVAVEDKTCVYLPFDQLFTGYSWGVKSKGLKDYPDEQIKKLDVEDGTPVFSIEKFEQNTNAKTSYTNGESISVGDLFKALEEIDYPTLAIKSDKVQVSISPVSTDEIKSTANGTYAPSSSGNWEDGTIEFSGTGEATVTITDYYFCKPATINVTITDPEPVKKFDLVFENTEKYLYRVGNADKSTVTLGTLFKAKEDTEIGNVSVTVEAVDGTAASGTYTSNETWTNGTIQFAGTGVVKVTITDDDYCTPTVLYLEVVDAKNATSAISSDSVDIVFLNDVTIASDGTVNYKNCSVYGNGFTFDVRGGMNKYNSKQGHGIIITNGAILDNLVVLGDVYESYGAYTNQEDYTSAIDATNTVIQNCHISNCSTPVRANGVTIKNTTLYGGTVANLIISGGVNALTDVTTVNYNDGRDVLGFGIVISDGASENVKLVLDGELKQHNFVCENDAGCVPDTNAKSLFNSIFDSKYEGYHHDINGTIYANTGIISMVSTFNGSDITDRTGNGYEGDAVSYSVLGKTVNGYLYSLPAGENSVDNGYNAEVDTHKATVQSDILPLFKFNLGDQLILNDGADDTRYLTGDKNQVEALYQNNEEPIKLDLTRLGTISKYGVDYNVSVAYKNSSGYILGENETVELLESGVLAFTVTDNLFYDYNGNELDKSVEVTFEVPITVSVKQVEIKNATITVNNKELTGTYTPASIIDNSQYLSFNPLDAISVTDYDANGTGTTVDLSANISSTEVSYVDTTKGAWGGATITMVYSDGRTLTVVLGETSINSPGTNNGGKTITVTNGAVKSDGKVAKSSATGGTWPIKSYSFKGNNGSTVTTNNDPVTVNFANSSNGGGGCVTPGTYVTLADGTQKRIDQIEYTDDLLVWDFNKGEYTTAKPSIIDNHGYDNYEVVTLEFEDGTTVNTINGHGFYDKAADKFVILKADNVANYIGHEFIQQTEDGNKSVKLVSYSIDTKYTESWSILTAGHYNCIFEDMLALTPAEYENTPEYLMPFEIKDMKYDEAAMNADIEEYGLYTYEDFEDYITYEQFEALGLPIFKVSVGKGYITWDSIMELLAIHIN